MGASVSADGSFEISDLDPDDYTLGATTNSGGIWYNSAMQLNGLPVEDGAVSLHAGENDARITMRLDFGTIDASIEASTPDGEPMRDKHGRWTGPDEYVLLVNPRGHVVGTNIGLGEGRYKGILPPGSYVAIAGRDNKFIFLRSIDKRLVKPMMALGTSFEIKPGETTALTLHDRTAEIQNAQANLGISL